MLHAEKLILVNHLDEKIGEIEKLVAHQYGMLHRAFSIIIFRKKQGVLETLLQQRSKQKYHGGQLWTNACCSHPHPGENLIESAKNRLYFEMGFAVDLQQVGLFHYIAQLDNQLTENEMDHVLVGFYDKDVISFNPDEVQAAQWINVNRLEKELANDPQKFTPWFKQALALAKASI